MNSAQIYFDLGEVIAILGVVIGITWAAIWWLIKLSFSQFSIGLVSKFDGFTQQLQNVQSRLTSLEGVACDLKRLELEMVKRDGIYAQSFVQRDEFRIYQQEQKDAVAKVFDILEKINDKLDDKMSRTECERMHDCKQ